MGKHIYITIFLLSLICCDARAQSPHFLLLPGSVSTQIKGKANDSLGLYYRFVYIGTKDSPTFNGVVHTNYATNKDTTPAVANGSFSTTSGTLYDTIHNLDTIGFYCHIPVTPDYFNNGKGNLIVIWPTGARQSTKGVVLSLDTFQYQSPVTVTGFASANENEDLFGALDIYPNPANTFLNIRNTNPSLTLKQARILDYSGKTVLLRYDNLTRLDVSALKSGTYFLELNSTNGDRSIYTFVISR